MHTTCTLSNMSIGTSDLSSCHLCGLSRLGSQFFITLGSELQSLDSEHCVFGEVAEGREVLLKLNEIICDSEHRPYQDVRYSCTVICTCNRQMDLNCYSDVVTSMWAGIVQSV
jgi:hypothetical protein